MKKILLIAFCLLLMPKTFAIDWVNVEAKNGSNALLDLDSVREYKKYILYNIKVFNKYTNENVIITMQSNSRNGHTARIKYYKENEYKELNGDYDNMANNITKSFEQMEYGSIAHACYTKAVSIIVSKKVQISI